MGEQTEIERDMGTAEGTVNIRQKQTEPEYPLIQALSSANDALFCERSRLLKLQSENDDLKLRSEEDRKKIQYLLSLTKTGEQEITYLRNNKPDAIEVRPRDAQGERMLRTVYLPTANADSLILKVESLQAQLNEQVLYACCSMPSHHPTLETIRGRERGGTAS